MFSRSDHHHVGSPISTPAPTAPIPSIPTNSERLISRHQRLETLLDSALATLALIHDAGGPVSYSDHVLDVLAALSRHIVAPTIATPLPDLPTTAIPAHSPAATPNAPVSIPNDDTKRSHVSYARANSAETRPHDPPKPKTSQPDIVVRFADAPGGPPREARRVNPAFIYDAIHDTLSPTNRLFAGVRWTRNWNLIIQVEPDTGTTSFMIEKYASRIWEIIRPILHFPDGHPSPAFETGDPWHSVVFHDLPALPQRAEYTIPKVQNSLEIGGYYHPVKAISVLCTDEELARRCENGTWVSLRVTVETKDAAQELVDSGGMIMGGRYKATHYVPRSRSSTPRAESPPT
ncbi:hypothetical protein MVEN_01978700 [Mycena venus]|uniref:Uncharacterized protein n=1 Tax=Mycena venus TaxID=2733690 RepID=A0A8H7CIS9_9AGAR|nr:hypothetical protein MVEN_01978700 [Mycena venus]